MPHLIPELEADRLPAIWPTCAGVGILPSELTQGLLITTHRRRSRSEPVNYRPICLLSHIRKVIEGVLADEVREPYEPYWMQLSFHSKIQTEMPIASTAKHGQWG